MTASVIKDFISADVLVVCFSSYLIVDVNNMFVVSGSTITGVTEATENFFSWVIISVFVVSVSVEPVVGFIAI